MSLKSISIVLFGLALCCFLQGAQADFCQLKLWFGPDVPASHIYTSGEGNFTAPFKGWYMSSGTYNRTEDFYSRFRLVEKASSYCDYCVMTVFQYYLYGTSQVVDFRTTVGNNSAISLNFDVFGYNLECFPPEPEEEEEEEEEEEDRSGDYIDAVYQPMNEGDGETLPHELVELRRKTVQNAINRLVSKGLLPAGNYASEKIHSTEFSSNYQEIHRFNVQIRDESGVEYRIWFVVLSDTEDHEVHQVIDAGVKENRIGEFPDTEFKESQEPYSVEVEELGTKSVNQAVVKLQAQGILPQGNYNRFMGYGLISIEYSSIINMTEYPDHDDMLYRFNVRVIDQSGAIFRVWTIIATNYETPEYYELIDFGYKQSRLDDFTDTDWTEMNEDDIVQMRSRSVAQAIPRLQADGTLPSGQFTINKTYPTTFSSVFVNDNWPNFTSQSTDGLYRFDVQLSNGAGARFRIAVVVMTNSDIQPNYELIDYSLVENRFDEFTNTKFVSLAPASLEKNSIYEAVDRLVAKNVIPAGPYTISKTYPSQFSSRFEHPDYSTDDYILFSFTADVKNAAKTEAVDAIVIARYDDLTDYELIYYGLTR